MSIGLIIVVALAVLAAAMMAYKVMKVGLFLGAVAYHHLLRLPAHRYPRRPFLLGPANIFHIITIPKPKKGPIMNLHVKEAKRALAQIQPYISFGMRAIVVGYDDLGYMMSVHLRPLANGENTSNTLWSSDQHVRYNLEKFETHAHAIAAAVRKRWPEVKVYSCICTCCGEDLLEVTQDIVPEYLNAA